MRSFRCQLGRSGHSTPLPQRLTSPTWQRSIRPPSAWKPDNLCFRKSFLHLSDLSVRPDSKPKTLLNTGRTSANVEAAGNGECRRIYDVANSYDFRETDRVGDRRIAKPLEGILEAV